MNHAEPGPKLDFRILFYLFFVLVALGMLVAFCVVEPKHAYAQGLESNRFSIHVTNFGAGMAPVLPPYVGTPETFSLSQNFISNQPNGRQLRYGYVELVDSTSAASNGGNSGVDAIHVYSPDVGERKLMYAIGGKWLMGDLDTSADKITSVALSPYLTAPNGSDLNWVGDSAWYAASGARFLEHLQPGDTMVLYLSGSGVPFTTRVIRWVISNDKVKFTTGALSSNSGSYTIKRSYPNDSGLHPYFYQYRQDVYTGTKRSRPQVIYPDPDVPGLYDIRPAGIAESLHIDAIYFKFGDTSSIVKSYDTASDGKEYFSVMQVVDRNKAWLSDEWAIYAEGAPETFYFRFGSRAGDSIGAMTYRILGNTDTSLFLASLFVDTTTNRNFCDTTARYKADTADFAPFTGGRGYIYSSAGNFKTVYRGSGSLSIYGGGAVLVTPDSLHRDSLSGTGGIYFVRPLDAVTIPVHTFLGWRYRSEDVPCGSVVNTPAGQVLTGTWTWFDRNGNCITRYNFRYPVTGTIGPSPRYKYSPAAARYEAVNKFTFFPILDIDHKRDSMFIRSGLSFNPGAAKVVVTRWEIVRADLPQWSGMTEFQNQLYAWGDTTAPGTLNRSKPNVPGGLGIHAWSANDDILLGDNPSEAINSVGGYDDQLFIGQKDNILSTVDGISYSQIATNIGISGQFAVFPYNKEAFWLYDDGVYRVSRRDLSGHTVEKISLPLDPVFNKWSAVQYGSNVAPFSVNRALLDQAILTFNRRDQHLYLFFAEGSSTSNNRCLTYNLNTGMWDGLFTFGASAATCTRFHDTTRLIFGNPSKPVIYAYDYNYSDGGTPISADLQSGKFYFTAKDGWPVRTKLDRIGFLGRSNSSLVDTVMLIVTGDYAADTFLVSYSSASVADSMSILYSNRDNLSTHWSYKLHIRGDSAGAIFQPHRLDIDFIAVERND